MAAAEQQGNPVEKQEHFWMGGLGPDGPKVPGNVACDHACSENCPFRSPGAVRLDTSGWDTNSSGAQRHSAELISCEVGLERVT